MERCRLHASIMNTAPKIAREIQQHKYTRDLIKW
jgi:hypothetical protein